MKIKDRAWFPVFYMFAATLVLSSILILFGAFTKQRVKNNEQLAFERAVLEALNVDITGYSPARIHDQYVQAVRVMDTQRPEVFAFYENNQLIGYALPLSGPGFWSLIKGVIGIAADTSTIIGLSFYEQNETPGLGGEIIKPLFRDQFNGKKIARTGIPIEFRMSTAELSENSVHMITGATQTSTRLGKFLNNQLAVWRDQMKTGDR
ncbi:hypothetical protein A2Y85_02240 [candidate division WOR-3 bacterium RBG_13_43_14]|uniref:FMN-binding domain-containing protein n=1 Tax=candidate division WOR-3 bacterium RBG_13_43_14 TaxID=1802590 RepID=A0A1F4UFE4_UNCW3|nr:MAG: hypothetical protein A2Y85_02240 [candidate division WOR-3 bacterium RBG_13_43_14]